MTNFREFSHPSGAAQDNLILESQAAIVTPVTNFSENIPCPNCGSLRRNLVKLPDYCTNDTERCGSCDTFLRLVPKPKKKQHKRRTGLGDARFLIGGATKLVTLEEGK